MPMPISAPGARSTGADIGIGIQVEVDAYIGAGSQINRGGLYTATSGQTIAIHAVNETAITTIAGALGLATGTAGVGIGLDVEILHKNTHAYIDHNATVSAGGTVSVTADSSETMLSIAATVGVASDVGIAASISIADLHTETDAYIGNSATLNAGGAVTLLATDTFKTTMIAGSVGAAGAAGIGVANTTLVHTDTVQAYIGSSAQVTAAGTVSVTATSSEDVLSIAAGVAVGGSAGVAGSAAVNVLNETTTAYVGRSAVVTVTSGGDLSVSADDHTSVISIAGSLAGGSVGVGIGADVGVYHKHTTAYIDSGVTADVNGDIKVGATSGESLISVAAGISAGSVAVAVNAGVHVFDLHTRAFIGDDPTDGIASAGGGARHPPRR